MTSTSPWHARGGAVPIRSRANRIDLEPLDGAGPMGDRPGRGAANLGVSTVVVAGVSLKIAIPNFVMDAVNAAYRVIVPRDAVAGIPTDYGGPSSPTRCHCWQPLRRPTTCCRHGAYNDRKGAGSLAADFQKSDRSKKRRQSWASSWPRCTPTRSDRLHPAGQGTMGRRGRARSQRVRAAGRPPGSGDRGCRGSRAESARIGPPTAAAVDDDRRQAGRCPAWTGTSPKPTWAETTRCMAG